MKFTIHRLWIIVFEHHSLNTIHWKNYELILQIRSVNPFRRAFAVNTNTMRYSATVFMQCYWAATECAASGINSEIFKIKLKLHVKSSEIQLSDFHFSQPRRRTHTLPKVWVNCSNSIWKLFYSKSFRLLAARTTVHARHSVGRESAWCRASQRLQSLRNRPRMPHSGHLDPLTRTTH